MEKIDLHIHSYYSDGSNSFLEILELVERQNISLFSITDHNFIAPESKQIRQIAKKKNIDFLQGIEVSCLDKESGQSIHILGYSNDFDVENINKDLEPIVAGYNERAKKIIIKLNNENNTHFDFEEIKSSIRGVFVSRNLLAEKLIKHLGGNLSMKDALNKVRVEEDNAWLPDVKAAINIIKKNKGKAFLAHPGNLIKKIDFDKLLKKLKDAGLDGIEIYYPKHDSQIVNFLESKTKEFNLVASGGSDWHGEKYSTNPMGVQISENVYKILKERFDGFTPSGV